MFNLTERKQQEVSCGQLSQDATKKLARYLLLVLFQLISLKLEATLGDQSCISSRQEPSDSHKTDRRREGASSLEDGSILSGDLHGLTRLSSHVV
jgi:hypothetical protein